MKEVIDPNGNKSPCNVAYFTDKKIKPMILNVGACKTIQRFSGSKYIEEWKGTTIQVYVMENIKAFGELTDALRLREFPPRTEKEELTPEHNKWSGAVKKYKEDKDLSVVKEYFNLSAANEKLLKEQAAA